MAGFDDALERLVTDTAFRATLEQDPQAALADYDLTDDERELLTSQLSQGVGASGGVEQRTSKSGLAGALGMLEDAAGVAAPRSAGLDSEDMQLDDPGTRQAGDHKEEIDIESWSWGETQSGWVYDENSSCWIRVSEVGVASDSDVGDPDDVLSAGEDADDTPHAASGGRVNVQDLSMTKITDKASTHIRWTEPGDALTIGEDTDDIPSGSPLPPADDLAVQDPSEEAVDHYLKLEDVPGESTDHNAPARGGGAGKVSVQDMTVNMSTDPAGDPDNPVIVGSVYNAEEPEPSDGTNEIQDGLSHTVAVSEATDEPDSAASKKGNVEYEWKVEEGEKVDGELGLTGEGAPGTEEGDSHGMGSPYLKKALFDNTMDPSGDPDDLVADGDDLPATPKLWKPLTTGRAD